MWNSLSTWILVVKLRFEEPKECIFSNIYTMTQQLSLASAITRKQARAYWYKEKAENCWEPASDDNLFGLMKFLVKEI